MTRLPAKEKTYWSGLMIAGSQIFLGLFAAGTFLGKSELDPTKILVILSNLLISVIFAVMGWAIIRFL